MWMSMLNHVKRCSIADSLAASLRPTTTTYVMQLKSCFAVNSIQTSQIESQIVSCNYFNFGRWMRWCFIGGKTKGVYALIHWERERARVRGKERDLSTSNKGIAAWNPISTSILISLPAFCAPFDHVNVTRHFHSEWRYHHGFWRARVPFGATTTHIWLRKTENHLNRVEKQIIL